jgi:hypothetical protein
MRATCSAVLPHVVQVESHANGGTAVDSFDDGLDRGVELREQSRFGVASDSM